MEQLTILLAEPFWADWNPYGHSAVIQYEINGNVFDRLVEMNPDLTIAPGLATEWARIDDTTWEFELRDDVVFHDGQPFTAEDVKASIELATGASGIETMRANSWIPHTVEIVDATTVRLTSDEPYGAILNMLAITDIMSAEDIEQGVDHLASSPNGTGPYKLQEDEPERKVLAAHDQYHLGAPPVKSLVWEYVPDSQTRVNALLAGQADVIDRVEPDQLPLIASNPDFVVESVTATDTQFLEMRSNRPPFNDPLVRQAVAWAVDRQLMVDLIGGQAALATSHYAPNVEFQTPQTPEYAIAPERARELLEESGLPLPLEVELICSTGFLAKSVEVCELTKQQMDAVGFDVTITTLELGAWIDALLGEDEVGDFFHGAWSTTAPDPDAALQVLYNSAISATSWNDARTDELLSLGRSTSDPEARGEIYRDLQAHLWEQLPHVPLLHSDLSGAKRADIVGLDLYPNSIRRFGAVTVQGG